MVAQALEDMTDDEEWALNVREEELHALVESHEALTRLVDAIEGEFKYRVEREDKLAAGSDSDREYAREHGRNH